MGWTFSRRDAMSWTARTVVASAVPSLATRLAPRASAAPAPTFYVSASGDDNSDGLSPTTAWATIQRANAGLPTGGSTVLFRRGDTFYGELALPFGCEAGAFGVGNKPVLTMFKLLNRAAGWTEHSAGVWQIDLGSADTHTGYTSSDDANIGYLMVDGVVKPALQFQNSSLINPWDFQCDFDNHLLFVKTVSNPTTLAGDIKAAPNGGIHGGTGRIISCNDGANIVRDLHITGTGGHGITGAGADVHIHDCLVDYIGGAELRDGTNRRYGNGIENWVNAKRWLIENNEIAQVYDVAWSAQGSAEAGGSWQDLVVRNNYIHDCTQSFEFWSTGGGPASGFQRILIQANRCKRAGYSVFSGVRPDQDVRVHLLSYPLQTPVDITIEGNVFDGAFGAYSYHYQAPPSGFVTRNNTISLRPGQKLQYQTPQTIEQAVDWQNATGREIGSVFEVVG